MPTIWDSANLRCYNVIDGGALGNGTTDDSAAIIATVAIAAGQPNGATVIFTAPSVSYRLSSNVTVPSNVTLVFFQGAQVSLDAGKTLTVGGPFSADHYQVFKGLGNVVFLSGNGPVFAEWFGAIRGDNTFDNSVPINAAIASVQGYAQSNLHPRSDYGGAIIQLLEGIYYIKNPIVLGETMTLRGAHTNKTAIIPKANSIAAIEVPAKTTSNPIVATYIEDLYISSHDWVSNTYSTGTYGIHVKNAGYYTHIKRVLVEEWRSDWGVYIEGSFSTVEQSAVQSGNKGIATHTSVGNVNSIKIVGCEVSFNDTAGVYFNAGNDSELTRSTLQFNNAYNLKISTAGNVNVHHNHFEQQVDGVYVQTGSNNILVSDTICATIEDNFLNYSQAGEGSEVELLSPLSRLKTVIVRNNYCVGLTLVCLKTNNVGDTVVFEDNEFYNVTNNTPGVGTYNNRTDAPATYLEHGLMVKVNTAAITASTSITLSLSVPGADVAPTQLVGAVLRVDTALNTGETWNAAYTGGATQSIASTKAVAKNTQAYAAFDAHASTPVPTTYTDIAITRSAGGSFTAQGVIRGMVYYRRSPVFLAAP